MVPISCCIGVCLGTSAVVSLVDPALKICMKMLGKHFSGISKNNPYDQQGLD